MQNKKTTPSIDGTEEKSLEIIEKLPKELLSNHLSLYAKYANIEAYAKIGFIIFPALILIHNVFIAGNSYDYDTYNTIKNIELSIAGVFIIAILILGVIAIRTHSKLNKTLKESAKRNAIKTAIIEEEFNMLAVHYYGGRGIKLKRN